MNEASPLRNTYHVLFTFSQFRHEYKSQLTQLLISKKGKRMLQWYDGKMVMTEKERRIWTKFLCPTTSKNSLAGNRFRGIGNDLFFGGRPSIQLSTQSLRLRNFVRHLSLGFVPPHFFLPSFLPSFLNNAVLSGSNRIASLVKRGG